MPDWADHLRPRLASLRLSPTREHEIVEELSQHLEDRWRELVAGGASEDEATRLALVPAAALQLFRPQPGDRSQENQSLSAW